MKTPHLLLVDDDPDLAAALVVLTRRGGMELTRCTDVQSTWDRLHQQSFDLILLDINLPGASGLELLQRMPGDSGLAPARVAVFCQPGLWFDLARAWAAGAGYWLSKELTTRPKAWQHRVHEILDHASGKTLSSSLGWIGEILSPVSPTWGEQLNHLLHRLSLQTLGSEVLREVLLRALRRVNLRPEIVTELVAPEGCLNLALCVRHLSSLQIVNCLRSIEEQLWCLLDAEKRIALGVN